jgi:hypothetical protein
MIWQGCLLLHYKILELLAEHQFATCPAHKIVEVQTGDFDKIDLIHNLEIRVKYLPFLQ